MNVSNSQPPIVRVLSVVLGFVAGTALGEVRFPRVSLNTVGETNRGYVALADLNGDAVMDLFAGRHWFEGPSWSRDSLHPSDPESLMVPEGPFPTTWRSGGSRVSKWPASPTRRFSASASTPAMP